MPRWASTCSICSAGLKVLTLSENFVHSRCTGPGRWAAGCRLAGPSLFHPCPKPAFQHLDVLVPEESEHEPHPRGGRAGTVVIHDHPCVVINPGLAEDSLRLGVAQGMTVFLAFFDLGEIEVEDIDRARDMGALVTCRVHRIDGPHVWLAGGPGGPPGLDQKPRSDTTTGRN